MAIDGKTLGIALSGGGFRATLFGLGSLWRLNDAGWLGALDRVTSVSGGSILAGVLAQRWRQLRFDNGRASNFEAVIAEPLQRFCAQTIDIGAGLAGLLLPFKTPGDFLAHRYAKDLFGDATLKSLPVAGPGNPKFIFYATNLQTGRSFRFRQDMVADYLLGTAPGVDLPLSVVVAASSAFPPLFSPIVLHTAPDAWQEGSTRLPEIDRLRERIVLADGGVYDNMGLESLVGKLDIALVSDAGAPFTVDVSPPEDNVFQMGRVRDILIDQTRALRKRWLISEFEAGQSQPGHQRGAYWGIGTAMAAYPHTPRMADDSLVSDALEQVPTRLAAFAPDRQGHLINWGYALCDVTLRERLGLQAPPPARWPQPDWPL